MPNTETLLYMNWKVYDCIDKLLTRKCITCEDEQRIHGERLGFFLVANGVFGEIFGSVLQEMLVLSLK